MRSNTFQRLGICRFHTIGAHYSNNEIAERLNKKIAELENPQRTFEYEHQRTIGLMSVPDYAPKSAKVIAQSVPWNGEENAVNTSSRMLHDAIKPMKVTRSQRLHNARENVLDYTLNAAEGPTHNERLISSKKSRYSGTSSGLSSGGWIESTAAQEIENAIKRGLFDNIARGTDAKDSKSGLIDSSRNPQLDFTEYLMNNILKKQGAAPPWILKQIAVREMIERFREEIRLRLQERLIHKVVDSSGNSAKAAISLARSSSITDKDWEQQYETYHREVIGNINSRIRGYNLQAPATARRGYLNLNDEIRLCYANVLEGIDEKIMRFVGEASVTKLDRHALHSAIPPTESRDKHYGFKELIKDLFSRRANKAA